MARGGVWFMPVPRTPVPFLRAVRPEKFETHASAQRTMPQGASLIGQAWFFSRIVTFRLSEAVSVGLLSATRATGARAPAARKAMVSAKVASGRDMFEASGVVFVTASAIVEIKLTEADVTEAERRVHPPFISRDRFFTLFGGRSGRACCKGSAPPSERRGRQYPVAA